MTDLNAKILQLDEQLPEYPSFDPAYRRAPRRESALSQGDKELAIMNALRYIPKAHHQQMAAEFAQELRSTAASTAIASVRRAGCMASPSMNTRAIASRPRPSR